MGEHLDDNAASELVSGALSPSALDRAERHLAGCRDCRALVAALAQDASDDSNGATFQHERAGGSQVGPLPTRGLTIGDRVGRYLVLSSLGAGGMGVVFAAYDPNLGRKIALKLLRSGLARSSRDARNRLRREAQAIAQLSHPNVVSVYDVGTTVDGDLYIAMEFVEGDTLTSWLKRYPRTWREIIDVFVQAARGLAAAHTVGLLHRDFKPDNVLVGGDGRVRVTDFGLARSLLAPDDASAPVPMMSALDQALTATGTVLGTPRYMPPEQMNGPELDARSDQFSFCVALYEALYGSHPLRDGTSVTMLEHGDRAQPPPEGKGVPAAIGRAVLRGLERDRAKRFPSMTALINELVPPPRRSPMRFAALGVSALLIALWAGVALHASAPPPADPAGPPKDDRTRQQLIAETDMLHAELRTVGGQRDDLAVENGRLHQLVQQQADEIDRLNQEVTVELEPLEPARKPAKASSTGATYGKQLITALTGVRRPIAGCFEEWASRRPKLTGEPFEATLVVGLTVTPDGVGAQPRILSTPDDHPSDKSPAPSLFEQCVSEQIARARFPHGSAMLDVEVAAQWSRGLVNLWPTVIALHQVPRRQIELQ